MHIVVLVWYWSAKFRAQIFFLLGETNKRSLLAWTLMQKWTVETEGTVVWYSTITSFPFEYYSFFLSSSKHSLSFPWTWRRREQLAFSSDWACLHFNVKNVLFYIYYLDPIYVGWTDLCRKYTIHKRHNSIYYYFFYCDNYHGN